MILWQSIIVIWLVFTCSCSFAALVEDLSINGSVKSLNLIIDNSFPATTEIALSTNRLRIDLAGRLKEGPGIELSLEQQLLWANRPESVALPNYRINRRFDLEKIWHENDHLSGQLQLDRFNLHSHTESFSWSVGRQAIGFGRISLFSPLDVIAPFPPDALDLNVRPGVDAIKITQYFGMAGQLGAVAVFGDESDHNSYLLTAGENLNNIDLLILAGRLRDRAMFGLGLAGEIGKVGIKGEASWYRGVAVAQPGGDLQDHFGIAALEAWYRFDNGLVLIGEYLFNGYGSKRPQNYQRVAASAPIQEGLGFLLARHYLLLGPSYQFHPLVTFNGLVILNIEDRSSMLRPQLVFSLADNFQLDIFWTFTTGRKIEVDPLTAVPVIRSEFGSVGESGGFFLRWYF
ncbi:MAG: hypothetical protein OQL18_07320 [Deltaproteobacteria bacterium]|nr:hypothetical protein [Deltaproteobacteria bacterium]